MFDALTLNARTEDEMYDVLIGYREVCDECTSTAIQTYSMDGKIIHECLRHATNDKSFGEDGDFWDISPD